MRLEGKVALITGSTRGIGRATAMRFAREGAKVIVNGRNPAEGKTVVDAITAAGGTARYLRADLGIESDVKALIAGTVEAFGQLDILVNNAAPSELVRGGADALVADVTQETWSSILRVGLDAVFWCCKYALPEMLKANGGSIINISSASSRQGTPGLSAYSASKGGLESFTTTLASEYGGAGIRANAILVGFVITTDYARERLADPVLGPAMRGLSMTRTGRPEDVANAALFLASDESEFVTGSTLVVDGGMTVKGHLPRPRVKFPPQRHE